MNLPVERRSKTIILRAVKDFLHEETTTGAMMGPFRGLTWHDCHVSPLMSRPKDNNDHRIIVDLSYGGPHSVNRRTPRNIYDGHDYVLTLPSLDFLIQDILSTPSPKLIKVDIAKAFHNVRVDAGDVLSLGIVHEGTSCSIRQVVGLQRGPCNFSTDH